MLLSRRLEKSYLRLLNIWHLKSVLGDWCYFQEFTTIRHVSILIIYVTITAFAFSFAFLLHHLGPRWPVHS